MENKNCTGCRYYQDGRCVVPMYIDGDFKPGTVVNANNVCYLYEQGEPYKPEENNEQK